jgi:hypothetical protein
MAKMSLTAYSTQDVERDLAKVTSRLSAAGALAGTSVAAFRQGDIRAGSSEGADVDARRRTDPSNVRRLAHPMLSRRQAVGVDHVAGKFATRIQAYCAEHNIEIPPGFHRHPASRYVAVDIDCNPPRLVAATWFKQEDMLYYLTHLGAAKTLRLLDFGDRTELHYRGGNLLERGQSF